MFGVSAGDEARELSESVAVRFVGVLGADPVDVGVREFVLTAISDTLLVDTISSLGPLVAGYYGLTGLAGAYYFRSGIRDGVGAAVKKVLVPLLGAIVLGWVAVKNAIDLADPAASSGGTSWLGLGAPFVLTHLIAVVGVVGGVVAVMVSPRFARHRVPDVEGGPA